MDGKTIQVSKEQTDLKCQNQMLTSVVNHLLAVLQFVWNYFKVPTKNGQTINCNSYNASVLRSGGSSANYNTTNLIRYLKGKQRDWVQLAESKQF